ncbi:MAG: class I SAM-dependent methyltransferase [Halothiobacillaceae bacterium]
MRGIEHIPWLYDTGMTVFDALGLSRWRACVTSGLQGRVLEIGCGTGRTLPYYAGDASIVGIDPDRGALRRAARRHRGALLVTGRAERLPFPDGHFDAVVTSLCFCSVDDVVAGLAEIRRVLGDHGQLRMLEHVRARHPAWAKIQDVLHPGWQAVSGGCRLNRDTESAVRAAGFVIDEQTRLARGIMRCFRAHKEQSEAGRPPISRARTGDALDPVM